jgi:hypothetical protein
LLSPVHGGLRLFDATDACLAQYRSKKSASLFQVCD